VSTKKRQRCELDQFAKKRGLRPRADVGHHPVCTLGVSSIPSRASVTTTHCTTCESDGAVAPSHSDMCTCPPIVRQQDAPTCDSTFNNARSQVRRSARVIDPSMLQMLSSPRQPRRTNWLMARAPSYRASPRGRLGDHHMPTSWLAPTTSTGD
jgi:hypothetical protein